MVELNVDLGELEDEPEELTWLATVANIACGGHAGGGEIMRRALSRARTAGTRVAAHPSYPDRAGFGRATRFCEPDEAKAEVAAQCARLRDEAAPMGIAVVTVKAHGALYHDAATLPDYAAALIEGAALALPGLRSIVGPPDTALQDIVQVRGLGYEREGFVDRRYEADLRLVPRSRHDALLTDPESCVSQALMLAKVGRFDTLCMHGDTPGAVGLVTRVRAALSQAGLLSPGASVAR